MKPFLCLRALPLALLLLVCGVCLGWLLPEAPLSDDPGGAAVPAMAYSGDELEAPLWSGVEAAPDAASDVASDAAFASASAPAATPENLFSLAVADDGDAPPAGQSVSSGTAPAPETPPPSATPAPPAAFSIRVLERQEHSPVRRRVLIYHTHTYEAYEKQEPSAYQETQRWRTADENHNVVQVGETLAGLLRGLGFQVEHDRTAFEPPELSTAYARSLSMLEGRKAAGESYDLYIDLHRDAYAASGSAANTIFAGDTELARLMLLVGKGEGQTGQGFEEKPDWEKNLQIAQRITDSLNAQVPGLCKDVMVKSGRYNQHVAAGCVLIEAGNNQNTLAQTLAAMPYLADAIDGALTEEAGEGR